MKKVIILALIVIATSSIVAQEKSEQLYLLFEFMQVDDHNGSDYWEIEDFWSEIHKQRIADNSILGWDLWQLTPSGSKQGSQFMTTTLFNSLEAMLQGMPGDKFNEYLQKAHPDKSKNELDAMMEKTVLSRDMAHQVFAKEISTTDDEFEMKVGTVMTMDIMKQVKDSYVKMENEIFKPWHQEQVDNGKKGNWGLVQIILPTGSEAYASHFTYSMFENLEQLTTSMESWEGGDMDLTTELAVQEGFKTREWKELKIARLVMMVR